MSRRKLREHLFKLIFLAAFNSREEMEEQIALYFDENEGISAEDRELLTRRFKEAQKHFSEIDELLNKVARGWTTNRFASCDLAVLRLAVYELRFDSGEKVPEGVAINEAVELAKQFGGDESPSFVNGLLGQIVRMKD